MPDTPTDTPREYVQFAPVDTVTPINGESAGVNRANSKGGKLVRMETSKAFGIPKGFFQSRAYLRSWGVEDEDLVDPSIQPVDPNTEDVPKPFRTTLPGYAEQIAMQIYYPNSIKVAGAASRKALGPDLVTRVPRITIPSFRPNPSFSEQPIGYDWTEQDKYQMDMKPYVNAVFSPVDPMASQLYKENTPWSAYPFGVPRVEKQSVGWF